MSAKISSSSMELVAGDLVLTGYVAKEILPGPVVRELTLIHVPMEHLKMVLPVQGILHPLAILVIIELVATVHLVINPSVLDIIPRHVQVQVFLIIHAVMNMSMVRVILPVMTVPVVVWVQHVTVGQNVPKKDCQIIHKTSFAGCNARHIPRNSPPRGFPLPGAAVYGPQRGGDPRQRPSGMTTKNGLLRTVEDHPMEKAEWMLEILCGF